MNFFKKKTELGNQSAIIRSCLSKLSTPSFPNGLFGQISIENKKGKWHVELPFEPSIVENELNQAFSEIAIKEGIEPCPSLTFKYQAVESSHKKNPAIKTMVAISSGKGGVGKSTVTANLAVSLAQLGHKVGILDADIYGPSMPLMFGLENAPMATVDDRTMQPFQQHGVYLNSIGFLVPKDKAAIWRGPMASKALLQLLQETNWPELDVLLIDMPPGTGDIQITVSEQVKCDGAVIVTTPQNVALADAEKGIQMFQRVETPILGLVENMSHFVCHHCGSSHSLFGADGGMHCAEQHQIPLLARLPLIAEVREAGDHGQPFASTQTDNIEYRQLAFSLMMQLSKQTTQMISTQTL